MKRLFRFLKALFRYLFIGHTRNVTFGEYAKRIATCNQCEHHNESNYTCGLCGCYLDKKCKWATEKCVIDKW